MATSGSLGSVEVCPRVKLIVVVLAFPMTLRSTLTSSCASAVRGPWTLVELSATSPFAATLTENWTAMTVLATEAKPAPSPVATSFGWS